MSIFYRAAAPVQRRDQATADSYVSALLGSRSSQVPAVATVPEQALGHVAAFASANLLANSVRILPVDEFTGRDPNQRLVTSPDALLLDPSGEQIGWGSWIWQVVMQTALRGNAIGRIVERDGNLVPKTITLLDSTQVRVSRDNKSGTVWSVGGARVPTSDIWNFRMYPMPGAVGGLSVIQQHARMIGLGMSSVDWLNSIFEDGAIPTGIITTDNAINADAAKTIKERVMSTLRGSREPIVLGKGVNYQQVAMSPADMALIQQQQWSSTEVARIFGPGVPELLGYSSDNSMTYANIGQRMQHFLTLTLEPWLDALEDSLSRLIAQPRWVQFNRDALLRTDTASRYVTYQQAVNTGWLTINEVRALEDRPPVLWGDEPPPIWHKGEAPAQAASADAGTPPPLVEGKA